MVLSLKRPASVSGQILTSLQLFMSFSLNDVALLLNDFGICVLVLALACYTSTIRQIAGVFAYDLQHSGSQNR